MKQRGKQAGLKTRNSLHDHPLLRKCAAHGKSKKAQRRGDKIAFQKEWRYQSALLMCCDNTIPADVAQLVERRLPMSKVESSSLFVRSKCLHSSVGRALHS